MNIREGTRRLALLLGVAGAIAGGFASYLVLQPALDQRARHNEFELLANSDVVQQERKLLRAEPNDWQTVPDDKWAKYAVKSKNIPQIDPKTGERIQAAPDFIPDDPVQDYIALPRDQQLSTLRQLSPKEQDKLLAEVKQRKGKSVSSPLNAQSVPGFGPPEQPNDLVEWSATGRPLTSQPNKGGIKNIHWTENFGVESIEAEDGQHLYPTPAPAAGEYLLGAFLPVIGFLIPWGLVRAIGWVGAGFVANTK